MIRIIYFFIVLLVIYGCNKKKTKLDSKSDNDSYVESDNTRSFSLFRVDDAQDKEYKPDGNKIYGHIYAYADDVKIYSTPDNSAPVIGTLNYADSLDRIQWYRLHNGEFDDDGYNADWLAVFYEKDTAWISTKSNISTTYSIDSIGSFVIKNYYGRCEYGGYGCYEKTIVYNWEKETILFNQYFDIATTFKFNDSILVLCPWDELYVYNLNNDSVIYKSKAKIVTKSKLADRLYFVRYNPDSARNHKNIAEFIQYVIAQKKEQQLYIEPDDSTFLCYVGDGTHCYPMELKLTKTKELITVKLYRYNKDFMDEVDANKLIIEMDNHGNILERTIKY